MKFCKEGWCYESGGHFHAFGSSNIAAEPLKANDVFGLEVNRIKVIFLEARNF